LSTLVDKSIFAISAQLDLIEVAPKVPEAPKEKPEDALPMDLRIGTLDPDELIQRYADPETQAKIGSFLSGYRIQKATLTVGLTNGVSDDVKTMVETWLKTRTSQEFGGIGAGSVSFVKQKQKKFIEQLSEFQGLAGQGLIAIAIIMGALLWMISRKGASSDVVNKGQLQSEQGGASAQSASNTASGDLSTKTSNSDSEDTRLHSEIASYSQKLAELGKSLSSDTEAVLRSWCEEGETGKLKLACFTEAAGRSLGRLPIPVDAIQDLTKIFATMSEMPTKEKRDLLNKAYWDLISAVNLGADTLKRPFGYLATLNVEAIGQALIEQNTRMKALVSLHMPVKLRQGFLQSVDLETKKLLVQEAANLGSIPAAQYKELENQFKMQLSGGEARQDMVAFDVALEKMAEALSPLEEISVMGEIQGSGIQRYRNAIPSLAFLGQWPDDKLTSLLSNVMPNEIVAYLRTRPDLENRIIALSPPMAGAVAQDELKRADAMSDDDKNRILITLLDRVKALVDQGEVNLKAIFAEASNTPEGSGDGEQNAA
ncbi:MAG: hypothetical protein ABIR96_09350, partial [Bdellovibrionota bacterium]